jgi:hypothetical protein
VGCGRKIRDRSFLHGARRIQPGRRRFSGAKHLGKVQLSECPSAATDTPEQHSADRRRYLHRGLVGHGCANYQSSPVSSCRLRCRSCSVALCHHPRRHTGYHPLQTIGFILGPRAGRSLILSTAATRGSELWLKLWCTISAHYLAIRMLAKYLYLWVAFIGSAILYILLGLLVRGYIVRNPGIWCGFSIQRRGGSSDGRGPARIALFWRMIACVIVLSL